MSLTYSTKPHFGTPAPDFSLPGTDNQTYSLQDLSKADILVVVFTCNHCPYAQASHPVLIDLHNAYSDRGIQFVAINANDESAYPLDSLSHMQEDRYDYPFPYLRDETQDVARAYGAVCTPDLFVYNRERTLVYHGRINDNWQRPDAVTRHDLREALDALLAGTTPDVDQHPSMGCSIKWRSLGDAA
ncbi:MAG: thioredoxin family protein [Candidatus Kerfeldbacteria bacterium]|nr:thioredoxin family protein [Candidatus Kerfeldbacteria bacterium]